jgi:hypothetical protein
LPLAAVAFSQVVVAIHVMAVVVAFGITFAYPVIMVVGRRRDPRVMPWFHSMQKTLGRRVTNPALTLVVVAGVYLASDLHEWHRFFVQWGVGAALVLGALEGSFMIRYSGRLAELAERDIAGSGDGEVRFSREYDALFRRELAVAGVMGLLVLATIFLMVVNS